MFQLIDEQEYRQSKGCMKATDMKAEQETDIGIKYKRKEEVIVIHFFGQVTAQNVFFFCFFEGQTK